MATFKICVQEHQQRHDGLFPVSIRVVWQRKNAYIKTEYYVSRKQIDKTKFELKDPFIIRELNNRIANYQEIKVLKLGQKIETYSAKKLADFLVKHASLKTTDDIDFIRLSEEVIRETKNQGTSDMFRFTLNSIKKFTNNLEKIPFSHITTNFLKQYEGYLYKTGVKSGVNN